jgi:cytochrome P450 family 142 subfamily A polypeptide 1
MQYDRVPVDPRAFEGMMAAIMEFVADLTPMVEARRGCPMDDLVSVWANAGMDDHGYDFETILHEVGLFISGGAETTRTVIARGLRTFCDHNDQWELLAADPRLIGRAVDELVRWITPLHNFFRTAVADATIGETPVAAGDRVMLLYPSANRDEAVFDDPFTFDVTRSPNNHLGFGHGTHYCLGANLAKLELRIVLEELTRRITDLHVVEEVVDEPNVFAWAIDSFTLGFSPR